MYVLDPPESVINSAMLEGVMVALLEDNEHDHRPPVKTKYQVLKEDVVFNGYLRGAATDTLTVPERVSERAIAFLK